MHTMEAHANRPHWWVRAGRKVLVADGPQRRSSCGSPFPWNKSKDTCHIHIKDWSAKAIEPTTSSKINKHIIYHHLEIIYTILYNYLKGLNFKRICAFGILHQLPHHPVLWRGVFRIHVAQHRRPMCLTLKTRMCILCHCCCTNVPRLKSLGHSAARHFAHCFLAWIYHVLLRHRLLANTAFQQFTRERQSMLLLLQELDGQGGALREAQLSVGQYKIIEASCSCSHSILSQSLLL